MNQIVLMAEVLTAPEMRYTPDNLAVSSLLVSFPSKPDESPFQVRVSVFGDMAQQVVDHCQVGQSIVIEGQLHINSFERDGRTEKRAEINARRIHPVGQGTLETLSAGATAEPIPSGKSSASRPAPATTPATEAKTPTRSTTPSRRPSPPPDDLDLDEVPF